MSSQDRREAILSAKKPREQWLRRELNKKLKRRPKTSQKPLECKDSVCMNGIIIIHTHTPIIHNYTATYQTTERQRFYNRIIHNKIREGDIIWIASFFLIQLLHHIMSPLEMCWLQSFNNGKIAAASNSGMDIPSTAEQTLNRFCLVFSDALVALSGGSNEYLCEK